MALCDITYGFWQNDHFLVIHRCVFLRSFIGVFSYVADFLLIMSFHNITVKYLNSDGFVRCNSWFLCEWSLPGDSLLLLRVPCAVAESAGKFWPPTCRE